MAKQPAGTAVELSPFQTMMGAIPTPAEKKGGLGSLYTESTHSVSELFGAVGNLATAGRMLGQQAVATAAQSRIESSVELLSSLGISNVEGIEALVLSTKITAYIQSIR
jgi:hypothetical protein